MGRRCAPRGVPGGIGVMACKVEELRAKQALVPDSPSGVPAPPIRPEIAPRQSGAGSGPDLSAYPGGPLEQSAIPDAFCAQAAQGPTDGGIAGPDPGAGPMG